MARKLAYDVVIATRNRPGILSLSIPTHLSQSRPPERIIIVDSSDDPNAVRLELESIPAAIPLALLRSRPNSYLQRIEGALESSAPIVFLPDDDSLYHPGASEEVMRLYEADEREVLGAVSLVESKAPPPGINLDTASTVNASPLRRAMYHLGGLRADIENVLSPHPVRHLGESFKADLTRRLGVPSWLPASGASLDRSLQGFRMTFRREVFIRLTAANVFDGYALYEDEVAAMETLQTHFLAEASRAMVYHHRAMGGRHNEFNAGVYMVLNHAFLVLYFSAPGSKARSLMVPSFKTRLRGYLLRNRFNKSAPRIIGMEAAMTEASLAVGLPQSDVKDWYPKAVASCLAKAP